MPTFDAPLSSSSINEVVGVVRRVLEHVLRRGVIDRDPPTTRTSGCQPVDRLDRS
jgi:hypothetical protein